MLLFRATKPNISLNLTSVSTHETILCFEKNRITIREIVHKHRACNARVFGSVLHGTDHVGSDLDILIDPTSETTMFDIGAIRHELLQLLGVNVDVLTPNSLPDSFRAKIIAEAILV